MWEREKGREKGREGISSVGKERVLVSYVERRMYVLFQVWEEEI